MTTNTARTPDIDKDHIPKELLDRIQKDLSELARTPEIDRERERSWLYHRDDMALTASAVASKPSSSATSLSARRRTMALARRREMAQAPRSSFSKCTDDEYIDLIKTEIERSSSYRHDHTTLTASANIFWPSLFASSYTDPSAIQTKIERHKTEIERRVRRQADHSWISSRPINDADKHYLERWIEHYSEVLEEERLINEFIQKDLPEMVLGNFRGMGAGMGGAFATWLFSGYVKLPQTVEQEGMEVPPTQEEKEEEDSMYDTLAAFFGKIYWLCTWPAKFVIDRIYALFYGVPYFPPYLPPTSREDPPDSYDRILTSKVFTIKYTFA